MTPIAVAEAEQIAAFIDRQSVSFISSVDEEGYPAMKAMLPPSKRVGIAVFYFHTNTSSRRVAQYRQNSKASLYFCDEAAFIGLMLKGEMEVLEDAASKEMLWKDAYTLYYPGGVTEPDSCILKFTARTGRRYGGDFTSTDFCIA
jgi:general stress protein 26